MYYGLILVLFVVVGCQQPPPVEDPNQAPEITIIDETIRQPEEQLPIIIEILGRQGFNPSELTVPASRPITWINHDPQEEQIILTFQKDNSREFINSYLINASNEYTRSFQKGTYIYWTMAYGVKGKLEVE